MVDYWRTGPLLLGCAGLVLAAACSSVEPQRTEPAEPAAPEISADLEPFLTSYFATWSNDDMEGYRNHFHPKAMIYLVRNGRVVMAMPRDPFVDDQEAIRASSKNPGVERMTSFRADEDRQGATVYTEWELVQGEERSTGIDRFSLIRDEQWSWKIISILFYSTSRSRPGKKGR